MSIQSLDLEIQRTPTEGFPLNVHCQTSYGAEDLMFALYVRDRFELGSLIRWPVIPSTVVKPVIAPVGPDPRLLALQWQRWWDYLLTDANSSTDFLRANSLEELAGVVDELHAEGTRWAREQHELIRGMRESALRPRGAKGGGHTDITAALRDAFSSIHSDHPLTVTLNLIVLPIDGDEAVWIDSSTALLPPTVIFDPDKLQDWLSVTLADDH